VSAALQTRTPKSPIERYRHSLWLLTVRDLKVRYSTSALGYLWSIIDPLLMSGIYFVVFVVIFNRGGSVHQPYIIFLLTGLLPWMWFSGAVGDMTKAFLKESKLIRSTKIPRSIWVMRIVLSKGIEFLASLPVIAIFVVTTLGTKHPAHISWEAFYSILAIAIEAVLIAGIGLIVAPLVVFFRDLERAIKLVLRLLFYASPLVYGVSELAHHHSLKFLMSFNPLTGIFSLYRASFFPEELDWFSVLISAILSLVILGIGILVFQRTIKTVLKEI
jgi:ABC-2 type transport system permease protein